MANSDSPPILAVILGCVFLLMIASCCGLVIYDAMEAEDRKYQPAPHRIIVPPAPTDDSPAACSQPVRTRTFRHEGHKYILFEWSAHRGAVVHAPDCSCRDKAK